MTPPVKTKATPDEVIDSFWQAHQRVIGGPCPVNVLLMLTAMSAFETDEWRSMWCNNLGNIRGSAPTTGAWTSIKGASEIENGKEVFYDIGPNNRFAAYGSLLESALHVVKFLGTASKPPLPNRYADAWDGAVAGDVDRFVAGMKKGGYFTAGLAHYTKGVKWKLGIIRPHVEAWVKSFEPTDLHE